MTVRSRGQGYGFHAERRDRSRAARIEGLAQLRADRETMPRHSLPALASGYVGGMLGAGDLPELSGETFAYALLGACVGKDCRRRRPGLMVAINRCEDEAGRIVPGASAEI